MRANVKGACLMQCYLTPLGLSDGVSLFIGLGVM